MWGPGRGVLFSPSEPRKLFRGMTISTDFVTRGADLGGQLGEKVEKGVEGPWQIQVTITKSPQEC